MFTHGQLYVACSRVSAPEHLRFALIRATGKDHFAAENVVFKEVLLK